MITELQDGTFYAEIELAREGGALRISSRPSDAIALAVRYGEPVPIFADEAVLDEAGVLFEAEEDEEQIEQFREFLDQVTPKTSRRHRLRVRRFIDGVRVARVRSTTP